MNNKYPQHKNNKTNVCIGEYAGITFNILHEIIILALCSYASILLTNNKKVKFIEQPMHFEQLVDGIMLL